MLLLFLFNFSVAGKTCHTYILLRKLVLFFFSGSQKSRHSVIYKAYFDILFFPDHHNFLKRARLHVLHH